MAARSDGVPLFLEELVAAAGEDDEGGLPTSLQSSLLARLDRLGPARDVAQMGAVLGRGFPERLLEAAMDIPADALTEDLSTLTAAGIVEARDSVDGRRYEFRHALIRDAAYESLLRSSRVQLHRHVASVVEEQFREYVRAEPELLGHHLAHGGEPLRAAAFFEAAGRRLRRRGSPRRRPTTATASSCWPASRPAASATGARCGWASCSATP